LPGWLQSFDKRDYRPGINWNPAFIRFDTSRYRVSKKLPIHANSVNHIQPTM